MDKPCFSIEKIKFKDNNEIQLNYNDIVVFVGANNCGKSASLKEIFELLKNNEHNTKVIDSIKISVNKLEEEIIDYVKYSSIVKENNYEGYKYSFNNIFMDSYIRESYKYLSALRDAFSLFIGTEDRLKSSNPAQNINFINDINSDPVHFLYRDDTMEKEFCKYFNDAFNQDLIVNRFAGSIIPLHIGQTPVLSDGEDRMSSSYIKRLEKLPLLHEQGDGMRSFVGVLLNAFVANQNMLFIDEPEAFLHPPQAKLLAKMLLNNLPNNKQLFLSTHSEEFIKGLLDSKNPRLKVIRIDRVDNLSKINVLENSDIENIWKDSLLRHSNILSGLFHKKVIICESDSDCRFYSAILDSILENEEKTNPDILFIHCGGKHRMSVVVNALKKLNVPTSVIVDFDILNDENPFKNIFENLSGQWGDIEQNWKVIKGEIEQKRPELLTEEVKTEINNILQQVSERTFPKEKSKEIQAVLKKASPWTEAKSNGVSYIPNGDAITKYREMNEKLKDKGIYIVEVGELENYDKTIGGHGPKWVNEVLQKDLYNASELEEARNFMRNFI